MHTYIHTIFLTNIRFFRPACIQAYPTYIFFTALVYIIIVLKMHTRRGKAGRLEWRVGEEGLQHAAQELRYRHGGVSKVLCMYGRGTHHTIMYV